MSCRTNVRPVSDDTNVARLRNKKKKPTALCLHCGQSHGQGIEELCTPLLKGVCGERTVKFGNPNFLSPYTM